MLENLLSLVKEYAQENVVENPQIPNEKNDAVIAEATHSVANGLQEALANGQSEEVLNLFNSQGPTQVMSSPVAQNIQGGFLENITQKLGLNKNVALGLASTLIPIVLSKMVKRSADPANSNFNIANIIGSLAGGGGNAGGGGIGSLISQFAGGGNGGGIGNLISQFTGGNGSGIGNLISQFTGGGQQQQQSGGGGIADLISQFTGGAQQQRQQQQQQGGLMDIIKGFMK
jgi:hypothetical protein